MKKFNSTGSYVGGLAIATLLSLAVTSQAFAFVKIESQLDLGESNADVTSLQEFLASDSSLYPQGLVTGYFGSLTKAAVSRFQARYGFAQVGRVGPLTRDKINELIGNGGISTMVGTSPAVVMQYAPAITATTATFSWMSTNEIALGRMYYSTYPLSMNEGDINSNGFAVTSGQVGSYDGTARTSQSSMLTGLVPNTTYYYTIVATDLSGNVSVIGPNNTFRTNSQ
jgi:peptidoglycan hydrolase-like protein with peptidoglycan-binding domain